MGVETLGGVMHRFTDENSNPSIYHSADFSTVVDFQDRVMIRVFEGQRALTKENRLLAEIEFSGILPAPRGVPRIRVLMESHACWNHIQLTVVDLTTRRIASMNISPRSTYENENEVERKKKEAKAFEPLDGTIWMFAEMAGTMTLLNPT